MALGTIVSRVTGFLRLLLIFWAIGALLDADIFNSANTIPNAMYILVAGGVFNVVLVPQLVRAMRRDEDGGDAYANRIITLGLLVVGAATVVLVVAVPLLMRAVFASRLFEPQFTHQRESAEMLMYLCMPQVFFYGAFVLVGQVLNARGRFGPMMWAPIVNNIVSSGVLLTYIALFGTSNGADGFTSNEELLLGLGSTAAIALQAAVLVPYLRKAGFNFRPRFDFRRTGLGHTLRLGFWTVLFIIANQIAFVTINRLATGATTEGAETKSDAAGSAVYEFGFLISQVPHGVITVSLATAIIPTLSSLAADHDYRRFRIELGRTVRIALVIIVPLAVAVACLGRQMGTIAGLFGPLRGNTDNIGNTIATFALAMVAFTIHYLMLRGFYADEDNRTPFFIQVVIATVNVVVAIILTSTVEPARVAMMLALSYGIAYVVGSILSSTLLARRVGSVYDREMIVFAGKLLCASAIAAFVMLGTALGLDAAGLDQSRPLGGLSTAGVAGAVGAVAYVAAAKILRMEQLSYLVNTLRRRS